MNHIFYVKVPKGQLSEGDTAVLLWATEIEFYDFLHPEVFCTLLGTEENQEEACNLMGGI